MDNKININSEIIKRIRLVIEDTKLSERSFAKSLLYSPSYLNRILNGQKDITDRLLRAISYEYNISINWLKNGEGNKHEVEKGNDINYATILLDELNPVFRKLAIKVLKTFVEFDKSSK